MTLPDTTAVAYTYDSSGGRHDADLGRVSRVQVGATDAARYEYNGLATLVGTELLEAELLYTRYDLSGDFTRIDRFGRVIEDIWSRGIDTGGSPDYDVYRDLYDVDVAWDRASNVTRVEDNVYDGWDVGYSLDGRDRLTRAERGTWGGSSIGSHKQDERWTLTQTGNWDLHRLDLNGDGDFIDTGELDDRGTFNVVNEQTARDIDDDTTDEFTLVYDAAGHLTDDGENYEYVYDAFGRLRFVKDTSDQSVVAEYTYNGLGYRIGWHYDVDADGTVEANTEQNSDDPWFHFVYDTRWRIVAVYRVLHWHAEGGWTFDADPKERFVYHNAGLAGGGGSSYIDAVILRDRDANTAWEDEADGTLEERVYYCQNWRADVVALFGSNGHMLQQVRYDPYGVPFGISKADLTADGVLDSADSSLFVALYNSGSGTHPFADWNLDGTLNSQDPIAYLNSYNADVALGYGVLGYGFSRAGGANRKGYAGYEIDPVLTGSNGRESVYHVRHRVLLSELGRWNRRDPLGYVDGMSLYEYVGGMAVAQLDPRGTAGIPETGCGVDTARRGGCQESDIGKTQSIEQPVDPDDCRNHSSLAAARASCQRRYSIPAWVKTYSDCKKWEAMRVTEQYKDLAPAILAHVLMCKREAERVSRDCPVGDPDDPFNNPKERRRHCVWACCMSARVGETRARDILDAHECCTLHIYPDSEPLWLDYQRDCHNNWLGIQCIRDWTPDKGNPQLPGYCRTCCPSCAQQ